MNVKKKRTVKVNDPSLSVKAGELYHLRKLQRKAIAETGEMSDEIRSDVARYLAEYGDVKIDVGGIEINITPSSRSSIKAERLLERGVSPEIINYATDTSETSTLRVTRTDT